jgi:hypothetical protein
VTTNLKWRLIQGFLIFVIVLLCGAMITMGERNEDLREACVKRCLPAAADMKDKRCYCDERWKAPND